MHYSFSFKHMDVSPYLEKFARKKIEGRIEKFLTRPTEAKVSFYTSKKDFGCHVYVGGDGIDCFVSAEAPQMHTAVNMVVTKLETQLRRRKNRMKDGRKGVRAKFMAESLRA